MPTVKRLGIHQPLAKNSVSFKQLYGQKSNKEEEKMKAKRMDTPVWTALYVKFTYEEN